MTPELTSARCPNGGKVAYGTRGEAQFEMRRLRKATAERGHREAHPLIVYECTYCHLWHVGHDKYRRSVQ